MPKLHSLPQSDLNEKYSDTDSCIVDNLSVDAMHEKKKSPREHVLLQPIQPPPNVKLQLKLNQLENILRTNYCKTIREGRLLELNTQAYINSSVQLLADKLHGETTESLGLSHSCK